MHQPQRGSALGLLLSLCCGMLASWLHDWSPFLWRITETFGFRWYGLSYAAGFLIAWLLLAWLSRLGVVRVPQHRIPDAMLILVVSVIVGGRLGYMAVYDPNLLVTFTKDAPFWGGFAINRGGMAYHGAVVGVMVGAWLVSRGFREAGTRIGVSTWRHALDWCAFTSTIGLGLGRLANFMNGELLGKIVAMPGQPAPWWSVKFPQELLEGHAPVLDPSQQAKLDAILDSVAAPTDSQEGAIARMIGILQEGGSTTSARIARELEPLIAARHPSQLYQAFFEGVVLTAVVWFVWRVPRKPGVVAAWFAITYGALRVVAEFYRLPDAQFGEAARLLGLSRGQWLSVVMVVGGAGLLVWLRGRKEELEGGWGRAKGMNAARG